jgi:hypothetical protein
MIAAFGLVNKIRAPVTQDMIGPFGYDRVETAHRLDQAGQIIIVYKLRISKYSRSLAKKVIYRFDMFVDLLGKFISRVQKTEAVIISFGQKLHAPCFGQSVKCTQYFRRVTLKLLQQQAGNTIGYPKPAIESAYQIQKHSVGGKITFVRHLPANRAVFIVIEILIVFVKYSVVPQSHGLMHLKVETYRRHNL